MTFVTLFVFQLGVLCSLTIIILLYYSCYFSLSLFFKTSHKSHSHKSHFYHHPFGKFSFVKPECINLCTEIKVSSVTNKHAKTPQTKKSCLDIMQLAFFDNVKRNNLIAENKEHALAWIRITCFMR